MRTATARFAVWALLTLVAFLTVSYAVQGAVIGAMRTQEEYGSR